MWDYTRWGASFLHTGTGGRSGTTIWETRGERSEPRAVPELLSQNPPVPVCQNASEIIPLFHKYTIWLPFNIIGDKLRSQSRVFDLFLVPKTPRIERFKACILAY